jgi:hypothetical protein
MAGKAFQVSHPCPATGRATGARPSYVVDHIVPLKCADVDFTGVMWVEVRILVKTSHSF